MAWRQSLCVLEMLVLVVPACSDDSTPLPDARVGPDSCCAGDGPLADLPPPATDAPLVDLVLPPPDLPPPDLPPPDRPPAPDLAGKKKLLAFAQCSTNAKCKPYCGAIGSKSEGWYDGCTNQMLQNPSTGSPFWDLCASCVVTCDAIGTYSEGWYAQCP